MNIAKLNFEITIEATYLCVSSFKSYPIKKGGGNGPDETLATYASVVSD